MTESHGGYYQKETEDRDGESKATAFCFVNTPTEIEASKEVDLGKTKVFDLDDREFGFTLTNDGGIEGSYLAVITTKPKTKDEEEVTEYKQITVGQEFYLKNRQSIKIYDLPIYKDNDGKNKITYYIEETNTETDLDYETEFRTEIKAENTNLSESVRDETGSIQHTETGESLPSLAFRNILEGEIRIVKTDSTGKKLQNVEFLLKYSTDGGTNYKTLDSDACSDQELLNNKGIARTDEKGEIRFKGLTLGYKYQLTESRSLAGTQGLSEPIANIELPVLLNENSRREIKPVAKTSGGYVYVKLKYEISNNTVTMPMTSGSGFFWPGILGLIVTGFGGMFWMHSGRTGKKKGEYAK